MLSCHGCKRFLREDSQRCPFCEVVRTTTLAPVAIVVVLGVAIAACGPSVVGGEGGASTTDDDGGTSTVGISVSATADDGPITSPGTNNTTSPGTSNTATLSDTVTMSDSATATDPLTGEDDVVDDEGCAFYGGCPFDGGPITFECDVWAQDCPEGEKCMPWANDGGTRWNATRCSPLDPTPNFPGEACTVEGSGVSGIDDCELGAMCWDVDPATNEGTCVAMCSGNEAAPGCADDSNTECLTEYDGAINLCLPLCDPQLQDCSAQATCVPDDLGFFCVPDQSGKSGQTGTGCNAFDGCDPGHFCGEPEYLPGCADLGCCAEYCDLALPDPHTQCTGNEDGVECLAWFEGGAPPAYETLGACRLPS